MCANLFDIHILHSLETSKGKLPMEVSLHIPIGGISAITGPSGAGKTTLLRQMAGLVMPQTGRITFGESLWLDTSSKTNIPTQKRNIGFVFQDYALFPHFTVRQNLAYGLEKGSSANVVDELLSEIGLTNLADRKPFQLSGGQQQRVALARALVRKPDLLLLDEPLSALDHSMRATLQDLILRFHQQYGFTMIIVTHDLGEIFRLADLVIRMEHGKVVQQGRPSEVYLPDDTAEDDLILYGEVLASEILAEHVLVRALVGQRVRELKFPLDLAARILPGQSFVLKYAAFKTDFELINR